MSPGPTPTFDQPPGSGVVPLPTPTSPKGLQDTSVDSEATSRHRPADRPPPRWSRGWRFTRRRENWSSVGWCLIGKFAKLSLRNTG